jgi:hypothetical protein
VSAFEELKGNARDASRMQSVTRSWSLRPCVCIAEIASELAVMGYTNKRGAPYSRPCVCIAEIASELAVMGYTNKRGAPYSASCVKSMVEGPTPSAIARDAT